MRYQELLEAPLTDIQVHGDLDSLGSFNAVDRKTIKQNILQNVYTEKLKKIPFDLNVFVLNKEGLYQLAKDTDEKSMGQKPLMGLVIWEHPPYIIPENGKGQHDASFLEALRPIIAEKSNDGVNLILGSGYASGGGWIKMTPWMMIHRLLHTISYDTFNHNLYDGYTNMKSGRKNKIIVPWDSQTQINWWDVAMMKSHSDPEMDNDSELFLEFGVEYLILGKIRINYELIKTKCATIGQDYPKTIAWIEKSLAKFAAAMDSQVQQMKGTTRYI